MPDILTEALATPGLVWLIVAIAAAGLVRGFSGFGTALIFVPVANIFIDPKQVIVVIALTGIASNAVILPRAWRQGSRAEVGILVAAALLTVPLGLLALDVLNQMTIRWIITAVAGGMLSALMLGWRYSRPV
ncbi:MAG: TSUP family transporter, partial [Pseudomonadota bacterium]